jgi:hypothetical protein
VSHENISKIVTSYEHDDAAQLVLVIERLEDTQLALSADRLSQTRGALILLDHLAETLLLRHVRTCFARGETRGPVRPRVFLAKERALLERSFPAKLDLAGGIGDLGEGVPAIIDLDQHAALGLAHAHRNAVYHRDRHKEGVLLLLVMLQFAAISKLWPVVTPDWTLAGLREGSLVETLARYGVEPEDRDMMRNAINLPDAARRVATQITEGLVLPVESVAATLAWDLLERVEVASGAVRELIEGGMDPGRIDFVFANHEFWDRHGADPVLIELSQRSDHWLRHEEADEHHRFPPEVEADMNRANNERNERVVELQKAFKPRATLRTVSRVNDFAERIAEISSMAELLSTYRELDESLDALEAVVPEAVRVWDKMVEDAVDAAREARAG